MTENTTPRYGYWPGGSETTFACNDCGAVVFHQATHDDFHDALEYAARAASRADGRTRRIG